MLRRAFTTTMAALCIGLVLPARGWASDNEKTSIETIVTQAVRPLMEHEGIPGMAVGIVFTGQSYVFNFGKASRTTGRPVNDNTLFEIG